jgi:hypothetical protein
VKLPPFSSAQAVLSGLGFCYNSLRDSCSTFTKEVSYFYFIPSSKVLIKYFPEFEIRKDLLHPSVKTSTDLVESLTMAGESSNNALTYSFLHPFVNICTEKLAKQE